MDMRARPYVRAYVLPAVAFLLAAGVAAEPPREIRIPVRDRLGGAVPEVSACAVGGAACEKVALRADKDDWVVSLPLAPEPGAQRLRLSAPGFLPTEIGIPAEASELAVLKLKAKGSVRVSFTSPDEKREALLIVSLSCTMSSGKETVLEERKVALAPRPRTTTVAFEDVPPASCFLRWQGSDLARDERSVRVEAAPVQAGLIAVRRGVTVDGFLRDDLGQPIPNGRVWIEGAAGSGWSVAATSGEDGSFALVGVPTGESLRWRVYAEDHLPASGIWGGETHLPLLAERAPRVMGRVVDEKNEPVAGVPLRVAYRRRGLVSGGGVEEKTDADGAFSFRRLRPLEGTLSLRVSGFAPADFDLDAVASSAGGVEKELDLGTIVLRRGRVIHGRVTDDATGKALDGAEVQAWGRRADSPGRFPYIVGLVETGLDGTYELSGLAEKEPVVVSVSKEGFAPASREAAGDELDIALGRGGRVEGVVCGTPEELATSRVVLDRLAVPRRSRSAPIGAGGQFVIDLLEPGPYSVSRQRETPAGALTWSEGGADGRIQVEAGQTTVLSLGCAPAPSR